MMNALVSRSPARTASRWVGLLALSGSLLAAAPVAQANDFPVVLGMVTGAVIGHSLAGQGGAIVGAGAGGLVGASLSQQHHYPVQNYPVQNYAPQPAQQSGYYQTGYANQPVVTQWQAPPQVVYQNGWRESHHGHHGRPVVVQQVVPVAPAYGYAPRGYAMPVPVRPVVQTYYAPPPGYRHHERRDWRD
jgi:hypothetical protein